MTVVIISEGILSRTVYSQTILTNVPWMRGDPGKIAAIKQIMSGFQLKPRAGGLHSFSFGRYRLGDEVGAEEGI
jgi:hypothetical protein